MNNIFNNTGDTTYIGKLFYNCTQWQSSQATKTWQRNDCKVVFMFPIS